MSDLLTADIPLGADRFVRIQYPPDLTPEDVAKVSRVLALLPASCAALAAEKGDEHE